MTHICVTLSILRDPFEIVSLVSSGLGKVNQLEHGDAISFNAFSYLQSNCFWSKCNIITTQEKYKITIKGFSSCYQFVSNTSCFNYFVLMK